VAAEAAYLDALASWNQGRAYKALLRGRAALALDPDLDPARLLVAHALARLGEFSEADTAYTALLEGPRASEDPAVRTASKRGRDLLRLLSARDQLSVYGASELALRPTGEGISPALGYAAGIDVPLLELFGVAAEVAAWDPGTSQAVVEGPIVDIVASMHAPLGRSTWGLRLKAGPSCWLSSGLYSGGTLVPQLGLRTSLGFDNRTWPTAGWYVEGGGWYWPGFMDKLEILTFGWELRAGIVLWMGPPRSDRS
jgi:hypothetical protein